MSDRTVIRSVVSGAMGLVFTASVGAGTPAFTKSATLAYVANGGTNNVQIMDVATGETIKSSIPARPRGGWLNLRTRSASWCSTGTRRSPRS